MGEANRRKRAALEQMCEAAEEERDRLRELFKKYINHVAAEEGSTFLPSEYDGFSTEEIAALEAMSHFAAAQEAGRSGSADAAGDPA